MHTRINSNQNTQCAVTSDAAAALLGETQLQESDLVPGKYEGEGLDKA
jgi:hypothetical protein